jgi:hypothetical protein
MPAAAMVQGFIGGRMGCEGRDDDGKEDGGRLNRQDAKFLAFGGGMGVAFVGFGLSSDSFLGKFRWRC